MEFWYGRRLERACPQGQVLLLGVEWSSSQLEVHQQFLHWLIFI